MRLRDAGVGAGRSRAWLVALPPGLALVVLAWWLGSPLFIRSHANEAAPAAAEPTVAASAAASRSAPPASAPRTVRSGHLGYVDALHHGAGEVRILETLDARVLRFEDVAISNAPDIQVYLSTDAGGHYVPENALHLGALRATNGSFNYPIPAGVDVSSFRSVVVWCRAFGVLITWADLA